MRSKVQKWGNSLAVRIPKAFVKKTRLTYGSDVDISLSGGKVVIAPAERVFKLEDLLKGVTGRNVHRETATGKAVGREEW